MYTLIKYSYDEYNFRWADVNLDKIWHILVCTMAYITERKNSMGQSDGIGVVYIILLV